MGATANVATIQADGRADRSVDIPPRPRLLTVTFTGFPVAALDFYDDLEMDNTRSFWEAHKDIYESAVRAPMQAFVDELAAEFGPAKLFRPHRDVRFSRDKAPYKTHQGAFVTAGPETGYYVQIAPDGFLVAAGAYQIASERLARIRRSIDDDISGIALEKLIKSLTKKGFELGGETLKTAPRGYDAAHPRIGLLRHKAITVGKKYGFEDVIHTPELVAAVRKDWRAAKPLIEWLDLRG